MFKIPQSVSKFLEFHTLFILDRGIVCWFVLQKNWWMNTNLSSLLYRISTQGRSTYVAYSLPRSPQQEHARVCVCVCVCGVPKTYGDEAGERERQSLPTPWITRWRTIRNQQAALTRRKKVLRMRREGKPSILPLVVTKPTHIQRPFSFGVRIVSISHAFLTFVGQ